MTIQDDINNLPVEVQETQPGHRANHKTIHAGLKYFVGEIGSLWTNLGGKANTTHSHTISDVTSLQTSLDSKAATSHTHVISSITGLQTALDSKPTLVSGKLPTSYLESVSIGETLTAASQSAMLALTAQPGDTAIRSDNDSVWMLKKAPATTLGNWFDITANISAGGVTSVNSQTGTVILSASDIGAVPTARTVSAGTGLAGGGDLTANRTVSLSAGSISSLTKADSAVQGNGLTLWTGTASAYAAIGTKSSSTVYVVTA